jgi:hypothetical protein
MTTNTITFTQEGTSIKLDGEASIISLLGMADALIMLISEKLEIPYNEVLGNFVEIEQDEVEEEEVVTKSTVH